MLGRGTHGPRVIATRLVAIWGGSQSNVPMIQALATVLILLLAAVAPAAQADVVGRPSVIDGDTIDIRGQRVRLHGIDAPEHAQTCRRNGEIWRCGRQAALALADKIGQRPVSCEEKDRDRYGRIVAKCTVDGEDLSEWLAFNGWAVAYVYYSYEYTRSEASAKANRRGIWAGEFVRPSNWRRGERLGGTASAPGDCRIKGNVSSKGERIYHVPGGRFYEQTRIDTSKGEHWFCSEAEAQAAGWRRSRR